MNKSRAMIILQLVIVFTIIAIVTRFSLVASVSVIDSDFKLYLIPYLFLYCVFIYMGYCENTYLISKLKSLQEHKQE